MPAMHPLIHLTSLAPTVRVTTNLQHILALHVLEIVLSVQRIAKSNHSRNLAAVNRVLALLQRAVNAARALRVAGQYNLRVGALSARFASEHGHVRAAGGAVPGVALGVRWVVDALHAERGNFRAQGGGELGTNAGAHVAYFGGAAGEDEGDVAADGILHAEHHCAGFGDVVFDVGGDEAGMCVCSPGGFGGCAAGDG